MFGICCYDRWYYALYIHVAHILIQINKYFAWLFILVCSSFMISTISYVYTFDIKAYYINVCQCRSLFFLICFCMNLIQLSTSIFIFILPHYIMALATSSSHFDIKKLCLKVTNHQYQFFPYTFSKLEISADVYVYFCRICDTLHANLNITIIICITQSTLYLYI